MVEGMKATLAHDIKEAGELLKAGKLTIIKDPEGASVQVFGPDILVDAILAKKNCGTTKDMAPLTIGLGPGFTAGEDVDVVVETKRGHNLGRLIYQGSAQQIQVYREISEVFQRSGYLCACGR